MAIVVRRCSRDRSRTTLLGGVVEICKGPNGDAMVTIFLPLQATATGTAT